MTKTAHPGIEVTVAAEDVRLQGELTIPPGARGIVVFAHGSGSSRHSPRNMFVARVIQDSNLATLLFDLLTPGEESVDMYTRHLRFDIGMLARRLIGAVRWLENFPETEGLRIGLFGASTGAAAALVAASELGETVGAVVSRGGRPDLAGDALPRVESPVLLIVGSLDDAVIDLNNAAYAKLRCEKDLKIVAGASHLFEEPGTLETAADLAAEWFAQYLDKEGSAELTAGIGN